MTILTDVTLSLSLSPSSRDLTRAREGGTATPTPVSIIHASGSPGATARSLQCCRATSVVMPTSCSARSSSPRRYCTAERRASSSPSTPRPRSVRRALTRASSSALLRSRAIHANAKLPLLCRALLPPSPLAVLSDSRRQGTAPTACLPACPNSTLLFRQTS
jgi:hypothetical protein